jgi:hypothetical protein
MLGVRRFPQYTHHPQHLEVQRFARYRDTERSAAWLSRRSHALCDIAKPTSWCLDALYLRHEDEWQYASASRCSASEKSPKTAYQNFSA